MNGQSVKEKIFSPLLAENKDILVCPIDGGGLILSGDNLKLECPLCKRVFVSDEGIPKLFWPNQWDSKTDVTEIVKSFYEKTPFPNYEGIDSVWSLIEKANKGIFARLLDEQIPFSARILEVGCGTGQVSNFLAVKSTRTVFGADACLNSLKLGQKFRGENSINSVAFVQMNLFRPVFRPESFHLAICNGVLHHTSDPFLGFQSILKLVKTGGYIIIGLYNTIGRIPTDIRRIIFNLTGDRLKSLDPRLKDKNIEYLKRHTWFMDQYKNPHESKHSIGEVLKWFDQSGVEFINCIPKIKAFGGIAQDEKLFKKNPRGTSVERFLVQLGILLNGGSEGGFFIMIGRKIR